MRLATRLPETVEKALMGAAWEWPKTDIAGGRDPEGSESVRLPGGRGTPAAESL